GVNCANAGKPQQKRISHKNPQKSTKGIFSFCDFCALLWLKIFSIMNGLSGLWDWNDWPRFREPLRFVERIENEFVGSVRLSTPLGPEAEEVDAAAAKLHFKCGGLSLNAIRAQQVSAHQRTLILGIRGQNTAAEAVHRFKGGTALEHNDWIMK